MSVLEACLLVAGLAAAPGTQACSCLPKDVGCDEVASVLLAKPGSDAGKTEQVTVGQQLAAIQARCAKGRLVDASARPIRFYRLEGCWGNPPEDYQEILRRQARELTALKKRYRVIELTCNPSGEQLSLAQVPPEPPDVGAGRR